MVSRFYVILVFHKGKQYIGGFTAPRNYRDQRTTDSSSIKAVNSNGLTVERFIQVPQLTAASAAEPLVLNGGSHRISSLTICTAKCH